MIHLMVLCEGVPIFKETKEEEEDSRGQPIPRPQELMESANAV
jgi:hypothetical protein